MQVIGLPAVLAAGIAALCVMGGAGASMVSYTFADNHATTIALQDLGVLQPVAHDVYPTGAIMIDDGTPNGPVLADGDFFGGASVASAGDLDGDGVPDLAVGATDDDAGGPFRGTVHVMLMNSNGTVKRTVEINDLTPNGPVLADGDYFGSSVAPMGDLDGDGVPDLAVGATGDDAGGPFRGTVHVMLMNADGTVKSTSEINDLTPNGPVLADGDYFGKSVTLLDDLDGDGVPDLAVGAHVDSAGGTRKGTVHVMLMNADGTVKSTSEINDLTPNGPVLAAGDRFGKSVASMGDLDGDGVPDLAAGAYWDNAGGTNSGAVHVMLMNSNGTVKRTAEINGTTPNGPVLVAHDHFGASVASMGDLDGDGVPDLASGAYGDNNRGEDNKGAVHVMLMNADGTVKSTSEINGTTPNGPVLFGHDNLGTSVASMDDLDGDGVTDLVAGTYGGYGAVGVNRGYVYVITLGVVAADRTPPAPANLTATSTTTSVTLAWNDPGDDSVTGYKILSRTTATQPDLAVLVADTGSADHTYTVNSLEPATEYAFGIIALSDHGESEASQAVTVSTATPPPPAAPANLTATSTTTSVTLAWNDPGDDSVTGYKILSRMPAVQPSFAVLVANTGSAGNSYTIRDLEPNVLCEFRVVALSDHGESKVSKFVSIHTKKLPPPPAPENLTATSTATSVTLVWNDPGDDSVTGYKILSRMPATQPDLAVLVADTGSADHTYTVDGLEPGTKYAFRVISLGEHGESRASHFVSIRTGEALAPAAPTNLRAASVATGVTISWNGPGDDSITGYKILYRMPPAQKSLEVLVDDTGSAATSHTVSDLEPGTKYVFRVISLGEHGESAASKPVSIRTEKMPPPVNLTATSTIDSVTISWNGPDDDSITGYKILYRMPPAQKSLEVLVADTGSADHTYTVSDLEPGTKYVFRVISLGEHGESAASKPVSVFTLSGR